MSSLSPPSSTSNSDHSALLTMLLAQIPTQHKIQTTLSSPQPSNGSGALPSWICQTVGLRRLQLLLAKAQLAFDSPWGALECQRGPPRRVPTTWCHKCLPPDYSQSLHCTGLSCASVQWSKIKQTKYKHKPFSRCFQSSTPPSLYDSWLFMPLLHCSWISPCLKRQNYELLHERTLRL